MRWAVATAKAHSHLSPTINARLPAAPGPRMGPRTPGVTPNSARTCGIRAAQLANRKPLPRRRHRRRSPPRRNRMSPASSCSAKPATAGVWCALRGQVMPFDVHSSRPNRRSDDGQTILNTVPETRKTGSHLGKLVELRGLEPLASACHASQAIRLPGRQWLLPAEPVPRRARECLPACRCWLSTWLSVASLITIDSRTRTSLRLTAGGHWNPPAGGDRECQGCDRPIMACLQAKHGTPDPPM